MVKWEVQMVASSQLIPSLQAPQLCVRHTLYGGKPTPTHLAIVQCTCACSNASSHSLACRCHHACAGSLLSLGAGAILGPKTVGVEVRKWEQWTSIASMSCVCCNLILKEGML